jgi:DNA invertase Pin-like site-specific DNA recombinase
MNDMKERERHGLPKHTVNAIRKLLDQGESHESIAEKFGTSRSTVGRIARGESYVGSISSEIEIDVPAGGEGTELLQDVRDIPDEGTGA